MKGRTRARHALRTGDLDPALLVSRQQCQQLLEGRLLRAGRRVHQSHVIDHVRNGQRLQARRELVEECGFEVQVHVPAERSDSQDEAIERIHVGSATQARDEREAAAVQAARGERFELPVSHPLVDISDASIAAATLGDRIEDHSVVATVRAWR